jgi:uncharacterized protein YaaN involved in tellurite resistance
MKQFMPDVSAEERKRILEENASSIDDATYQRPLTEDELVIKRESLADNYIKLNQEEDELKAIKDSFKKVMDPLKQANRELLNQIKTKQETVNGILYHLAQHEDGMMETYDQDGFLIGTRRLRPDEKQGNIFSLAK